MHFYFLRKFRRFLALYKYREIDVDGESLRAGLSRATRKERLTASVLIVLRGTR